MALTVTGAQITGVETGAFDSKVTFGSHNGYIGVDSTGLSSFTVSQTTEDKYREKDSQGNTSPYDGEPISFGVSIPVTFGKGKFLLVDTSRKLARRKSVGLEYPTRAEFFLETGVLHRERGLIVEISHAKGELNHNRGEWSYREYTEVENGQPPQLAEFVTVFAGSGKVLYGKLKEIHGLREVKPTVAGEESSIVEDPKGTLLGYGYFLHTFQMDPEQGIVKVGKETAVFLSEPQDIITAGTALKSDESVVDKDSGRFYNLPFSDVTNLSEKVKEVLHKFTARQDFAKLYSSRN